MDSPVSAFAVYKSSKKNNRNEAKRKKKQRIKQPTLSNTAEDVLIEVAQKVKNKLKKVKQPKNIVKTKPIKEKNKNVDTNKSNKNKIKIKKNKVALKTDSIEHVDTSDEDNTVDLVDMSQFVSLNNHFETSNTNGVSSPCNSSHGSIEYIPVQTDSREEGLKVFKWLIAPHDPSVFLNQIWEKKPLYITRKNSKYYKEIISTPLIDDMLRNENIQFTKNIDITSYVDGKRDTHNPEGRAHPHLVWDFYLNGCSIRLLNPQTYMPKLHLLNATLQEFFNSFVGANAYLTPPDSQGFAPHYDDIEAFILQVEGKKRWRIYEPRTENEVLPRLSSKNFEQSEVGTPMLEVTLKAGDLLYFPRGYIHQGVTIDGEHSLHVTVSMYQKHSWADLFEKMLPAALHLAITENVSLRQGLPFDIYDNFGLVNSDVKTPRRKEIEELIMSLFDKIKDHLPVDEAVDQMNKNYQHDALPPVLSDLEKAVTVFGDSDVMVENGKVINRVEIGLDTRIRLLRKNILRMVSEEDHIRLYYYVENSLEYHATELPFLEIEEDLAPAIETLITSYPEYVTVENLDIPNDTDKMNVAETLWGRGLIMTEYPLETIED